MKVITVATDLNNFFLRKFLVPSCEYFKYELVILYSQEPWKSHRIKDKLLIPYLQQLDSNELILFTDAYDTMMLNTPNQLINIYHQFDSSFIFSSESNCYPAASLSSIYDKINGKTNSYLNSGGFICQSNEIIKILNDPIFNSRDILKTFNIESERIDYYEKKYQWSNQYYWTLKYFSLHPKIEIDKNSQLFLTTGTPLNMFKNNIHEYVKLREESYIYKKEKVRINKIIKLLEEKNVSHFHFFNSITNNIFRELYLTNSFPPWIGEILNYRKITERTQVIKF